MNFFLEHLWKIIVIIVLAVAGWFGFHRYQDQETWKAVGSSLGDVFQTMKKSPSASVEESQGNYWKLLAFLKEIQNDLASGKLKPALPKDRETNGEVLPETALRWLLEIGTKSPAEEYNAQALVDDAIIANLAICEQYGIFNRETNLAKMMEGHAPTIASGPFEGQKLVITTRIAPSLAPDLVRHPVNFTLLPESVAAIVSSDIDEKTSQLAFRLKSASLLNAEEHAAISKLFENARR